MRAESATCCRKRDVAEALRAGPRGNRLRLAGEKLLREVLRGNYEEEVHHRSQDEEVDDRSQKGAVQNLSTVNVRLEVIEVRFADEGSQEGVDDVSSKSGNDGSESGTDDDGNRQVHHIAAQYEIPKSFEQGRSPESGEFFLSWAGNSAENIPASGRAGHTFYERKQRERRSCVSIGRHRRWDRRGEDTWLRAG